MNAYQVAHPVVTIVAIVNKAIIIVNNIVVVLSINNGW